VKSLLRVLTFTILSLAFSQALLGAYSYGKDPFKSFALFTLALTILYLFLKPILQIVSLPSSGFGYTFMTIVLTVVVTYALTVFVDAFTVQTAELQKLLIFGFVIPSTSFKGIWAVVSSSTATSLFYTYFAWLSDKR
jgi:uncharacterized membrane protein YvlD (DUF360 family)